MGSLQGRVALVTGGSRGFGRAIAIGLAREGADVIVGYRTAAAQAEEVAAQAASLGRRALAVAADLERPADADALAERAVGAFGRVDVLVNNAGIMDVRPFGEQGPAVWTAMLAVNVWGALRLTHALVPGMAERGWGRVINLSSQLGHVGGENFAVYAGTKAFLLAFGKSLAREVGRFGITVNAICPGSIVTDMNRALYPPERAARRAAELPLRRLGEPEDVAAAALYLASDAGRFVTGQCIDVNGGATMA